MNGTTHPSGPQSAAAWSDEQLVKACLNGQQEAWSALLGKYQNLIYSITIKYRLPSDAAADVFQQVCLQLLQSLPQLREPKSLASWLIRVTTHICFRHGSERRYGEVLEDERDYGNGAFTQPVPEVLMREVEEEQYLRDAMLRVKPRCRELVHMLFFEVPPRPYEQVAKTLGIAKGSVGFIRMRCLASLRRQLEKVGFHEWTG